MQELKHRLVAALDQLGERGAAGDGMEALHDWLHHHPQLNLDAFLAGANERLRTYFYQVLPSKVLLPPTSSVAVAAHHRAAVHGRRYLPMFYGWPSSAAHGIFTAKSCRYRNDMCVSWLPATTLKATAADSGIVASV